MGVTGNIKLIVLGFFCLFACSKDPEPQSQIEKKLLINTWKIVGISDGLFKIPSYDSIKCVDDFPIGYIDGKEIDVNTIPEFRADGFTDYLFLEEWTFSPDDSLLVKRTQGGGTGWVCHLGEPVALTDLSVSTFTFNAQWKVKNDDIEIFLNDNPTESYTFSVDSLAESFLILGVEDQEGTLTFRNDF